MRISELKHQLFPVVENKGYAELSPLSMGFERCKPGKFFGPYKRDYYLIHFIISGTGIFKNPNGEWRVNEGQAFLIRPGENCIYTADNDNPWIYAWLGFEGNLAKRFDGFDEVFNIHSWIIDEMCYAVDMESGTEEYLTGILFKLYAELFSGAGRRDRIKQVTDFIEANYMNSIYIEDIASMLNTNRKYLSRIFREKMGVTMKQYLTDKRLGEAKRFLAEGHSVAETAAMVGYSDSFNFSKAFKKHFGYSPIEFKKD